MTEWISPIDGHRHYGEAGRVECAVCRLQDERDRLRAVVDAALEVVRPMADSACDADVLRIADLYRILAGPALDGSADMGGDDT